MPSCGDEQCDQMAGEFRSSNLGTLVVRANGLAAVQVERRLTLSAQGLRGQASRLQRDHGALQGGGQSPARRQPALLHECAVQCGRVDPVTKPKVVHAELPVEGQFGISVRQIGATLRYLRRPVGGDAIGVYDTTCGSLTCRLGHPRTLLYLHCQKLFLALLAYSSQDQHLADGKVERMLLALSVDRKGTQTLFGFEQGP
jgi:hypothetical protein